MNQGLLPGKGREGKAQMSINYCNGTSILPCLGMSALFRTAPSNKMTIYHTLACCYHLRKSNSTSAHSLYMHVL